MNIANKKTVDVSVIIVNYNTLEMTNNCIESVFAKTEDVQFEVILVDNGSNDGSREFFANDKRIRYIYVDENMGFGRANNLGYKYCNGKYVFLLNSDTLLINNAIKKLYDYAESSDDSIACLGCPLVNVNDELMHSYGNFPTMLKHFKYIGGGYFPVLRTSTGIPKKSLFTNNCLEVEYVTGADLFIRKSVIEECGLFDESFFMYYEESDLQLRYKKHGYKSLLIWGPSIKHLHHIDGKKLLRRTRIPIEGSLVYYKKNFPRWKYLVAKYTYWLLIPKFLIYPDTWDEKIKILKLLFSP